MYTLTFVTNVHCCSVTKYSISCSVVQWFRVSINQLHWWSSMISTGTPRNATDSRLNVTLHWRTHYHCTSTCSYCSVICSQYSWMDGNKRLPAEPPLSTWDELTPALSVFVEWQSCKQFVCFTCSLLMVSMCVALHRHCTYRKALVNGKGCSCAALLYYSCYSYQCVSVWHSALRVLKSNASWRGFLFPCAALM